MNYKTATYILGAAVILLGIGSLRKSLYIKEVEGYMEGVSAIFKAEAELKKDAEEKAKDFRYSRRVSYMGR